MVRQALPPEHRSWLFYLSAATCVALTAAAAWLELGAVAVSIALFFLLFAYGFREKWPDDGPSAYSVFNPGQQAIMGTFRVNRGVYEAGADFDSDSGDDAGSPLAAVPTVPSVPQPVSIEDKLRRREAAAEAAERRLSAQLCVLK